MYSLTRWEMPDALKVPLTKRVLIDARKLIEKPGTWCINYFALNADGQPYSDNIQDEQFVSFCAAGAVARAAGLNTGGEAFNHPAWVALSKECGNVDPGWFNNHNSHEAVLAMFDRAIAAS